MNYREQQGSAQSWRRARTVHISNDFGLQPTISFFEEDVADLGGQRFSSPVSEPVVGAFEPLGVIDLINPETGQPLGSQASHQQLYIILHSLYIALAQRRDAAAQATADASATTSVNL